MLNISFRHFRLFFFLNSKFQPKQLCCFQEQAYRKICLSAMFRKILGTFSLSTFGAVDISGKTVPCQ